jgi:hypothetical protein
MPVLGLLSLAGIRGEDLAGVKMISQVGRFDRKLVLFSCEGEDFGNAKGPKLTGYIWLHPNGRQLPWDQGFGIKSQALAALAAQSVEGFAQH